MRLRYWLCVLALLPAACGAPQPGASMPGSEFGTSRTTHSAVHYTSPIQHVIILVQENRTPDYLFQGVPGADISKTGLDHTGKTVKLTPISLAAPYDLNHNHVGFERDYDGGKMDGFDTGLTHQQQKYGVFHYAPKSETAPYLAMAKQYAFADRMFQSNQSDSFPSHQYLVSGTASALPTTSWPAAGNPYDSQNGKGSGAGCDANKYSVVDTVSPYDGGPGPTPFPCFERPVLSDLLDQQGVSWRYYQNKLGTGLWHAMDAIKHVRYGQDYSNVITPPETVLSDISNNQLPGLSWVMPADLPHSDHPGSDSASGPSWIAAVVNAVGASHYWNSTAIFVTWDDWGGWYDHVAPPQFNNYYELGFRVPLLIISPYARAGYVSHDQHEFGSLLAFSEETFGIPKGSLGTTDVRADDLMDAFDFTQTPIVFVKIKAPKFKPSKGSGSGSDADD
ncbi:MAG TPA: alkaline phosphatase family protein [Candidatus Tumulicola sp.]